MGAGLICGFNLEGRREGGERVSHLLFETILSYFMMQLWSKSFIFSYCYLVFRR